MIRIGIIGAGGIVKTRHLPGLAALTEAQVAVVCNRSPESGEAVAAEWDIPEVTTDWQEVVRRDDLDAILIGTWPYTHAEMSIAALETGKHVFCQARMARDAAEAHAMLAAAQSHPHLVAMLCPPPQGMRGDRLVRKLIADGYLGELREVHATGLSDAFADDAAPLHWRQNWKLQGYNTLTLGMWVEVIHRWAGPHAQVMARLRTHTPERRDEATGKSCSIRHGESVAIAAELASGAIGAYSFSGVARHAPHNTIQLYGSEGTLIYDLETDEILGAGAGARALERLPIPGNLVREWTVEADWIRAIGDGGPVEPGFADGVLYMEFTEAVYRSAESGEVVELPFTMR